MRAMLGLSVMFLAFTLLFQDNMNAYTMQMNYQSYGQWLIQTPDPVFDDNPYLTLSGIVQSGSRIYLTEPRNAGVQVIDEEIKSLAKVSKSMKDSCNHVSSAMEHLSNSAQGNAAATEETSASIEEVMAMVENITKGTSDIKVLSDDLSNIVSKYQL